MRKIEHLGIAVSNVEESKALFDKLLGRSSYKTELVESEGVETVFYEIGESKFELVASTKAGSSIDKFISKKGEGIHHVALAVDDIYAEMKRIKEEGFTLLMDEPKAGADGKLICFLHPKSTNGVLVELCMDAK